MYQISKLVLLSWGFALISFPFLLVMVMSISNGGGLGLNQVGGFFGYYALIVFYGAFVSIPAVALFALFVNLAVGFAKTGAQAKLGASFAGLLANYLFWLGMFLIFGSARGWDELLLEPGGLALLCTIPIVAVSYILKWTPRPEALQREDLLDQNLSGRGD